MKSNILLFLTLSALLVSSCGQQGEPTLSASTETTSEESVTTSETSTTSEGTSKTTSQGTSTTTSSTSSGPKKVTVPAHTLSDSNPPINVNAKGERISESAWNSFKNAPESKFNGNYNYTYRAYSGGVETYEAFTKNGYFARSYAGKLYYERKSGSTFYIYMDVSDGYLREETTLDLQSKYTSRIKQEIYVHMFDFKDYEFEEEEEGMYNYRTTSFGASAKFIGGYLVFLYYAIAGSFFEIRATFETTIDIPKSYYYE